MDSHIIQVQCELLERESTAERNLLQAQERLKAIRTMRKRVFAKIGNQSHTPIGICSPKIRMTPNASTLPSPVLTEAKDLPDEPDEAERPKIDRPIPSDIPLGFGDSCSEPQIAPLMTLESRPQSVPANHRFTDTTSYNYDHSVHPSSDTAPGYLKSPHSMFLDPTLISCLSKPPPEAHQVNEGLESYASEPSPRFYGTTSQLASCLAEYAHICNETRRLAMHISHLQDIPTAGDEISSAEDALSLICEQWVSMLSNVSRTVAESPIFLRYESMMQALLSINPYLAPNFVPSGDIPWPILRLWQGHPLTLAKPSAHGKEEIVDFIVAYGHWSGQSFSTTVQSMLNTWTVVSTRFRSGELNIETSANTQRGYAMGLMKMVLRVLKELQRENHGNIKCKRNRQYFFYADIVLVSQ